MLLFPCGNNGRLKHFTQCLVPTGITARYLLDSADIGYSIGPAKLRIPNTASPTPMSSPPLLKWTGV